MVTVLCVVLLVPNRLLVDSVTRLVVDCSSRDVDKAAVCRELGFEWTKFDGHDELLLPDCAAYYRLTLDGELIDAGEHDTAICLLDGVFASDQATGPADGALDTRECRALGLVSDAGRAIAPEGVA